MIIGNGNVTDLTNHRASLRTRLTARLNPTFRLEMTFATNRTDEYTAHFSIYNEPDLRDIDADIIKFR